MKKNIFKIIDVDSINSCQFVSKWRTEMFKIRLYFLKNILMINGVITSVCAKVLRNSFRKAHTAYASDHFIDHMELDILKKNTLSVSLLLGQNMVYKNSQKPSLCSGLLVKRVHTTYQ